MCINDTTDTELPKVKYLNRYVRDKVCASEPKKWEDLGKELLDDDDIPALVAKTRNMDEKQCCSEMFKLWLERQPKATWRQLIDALLVLKLNRLAYDVENLLMQPRHRKRRSQKVQFSDQENGKRSSFCSLLDLFSYTAVHAG